MNSLKKAGPNQNSRIDLSRIPVTEDGYVNFSKLLYEMWGHGFHRPDPLGFCVIQKDMYNLLRIAKMTVEERQIEKGYMKAKDLNRN